MLGGRQAQEEQGPRRWNVLVSSGHLSVEYASENSWMAAIDGSLGESLKLP